MAELSRLWRRESWHPGLTLRLHELRFPLPAMPVDRLPGRVHVWLYTWNRADALRQTLTHLAASRLGAARVTVLDNGAIDDTRAVCTAMPVVLFSSLFTEELRNKGQSVGADGQIGKPEFSRLAELANTLIEKSRPKAGGPQA